MSMGHNTISAERLRSFVERIERLKGEQKELGEDIKLVKQEAKSTGFDVPTIMSVIKVRAMRPDDYREAETLRDVYLDAMGMPQGPGPLFRAAALAEFDPTVREQVVDKMKDFIPGYGKGDIVVTWGGKKLRLLRNKDGSISEQEVVETAPAPRSGAATQTPRAPRADVPDVDADGAVELGKQYALENRPVIDNPFPFGDQRRAKFDEGWRAQAGNDGMGPEED